MEFIIAKKPIHILQLSPACSATSTHIFHLHPHYEDSPLEVNISLDMVNLNTINISSFDFHIWQHLEKYRNESQFQCLAFLQFQCTLQTHGQWHSTYHTFTSPEESTGDTASVWTLFLIQEFM